MAILGGLGLLTATGDAKAATGSHLGESWVGSPGTGVGLEVKLKESGKALNAVAGLESNQNQDVGIAGKTFSSNGIGLAGHAVPNSGHTRGLVGRVDSPNGTALQGRVTASGTGDSRAVHGVSKAEDGTAILGAAAGSGTTKAIEGRASSSSGYGLYTPDNAKVDGTIEVGGDIQVSGVKNFVETVSTEVGPKQVKYTSIESGEPQTEHSDISQMKAGVSRIELPDHFAMVTSENKRLIVQVTPYSDQKVHPQVTDRSTDRIVVKDFSDGPDEYTFAYTVKGVRQGFEDQDVVSAPRQ